jgi:hypothetical protein
MGPGRGAIARVALDGGRRAVLKKLRRGGWAGPLWRDRFPGPSRPLANLDVPIEGARKGIPTAAPVALLLVEGPPGLFRAWLATEEIPEASDLLTRLRAGVPADAALLPAVLGAMRRAHDAGLVHPDLNLGNFLVRPRAGGGWDVFLVDLDGASLLPGPLGFRGRQAALRRFERSAVKNFGAEGPPGAGSPSSWYALYAAGDADLTRRLAAGQSAGRLWLAIHRLGWSEGRRRS